MNTEIERRRKGTPVAIQSGQGLISVICIACVDSVKCVHCALKCSPAGKLHHCCTFCGARKRTIPCPTKNVVNTEIERRRKGTPVAIQSGQGLISVICIACVDSVKCVHCALKCSPAGKLHHCCTFCGARKRTIPCPTKNVVNTEIERRRKGTPVAIQSGQGLIIVIYIARVNCVLHILWGTKTHNSVPHKKCCEHGDRTTA